MLLFALAYNWQGNYRRVDSLSIKIMSTMKKNYVCWPRVTPLAGVSPFFRPGVTLSYVRTGHGTCFVVASGVGRETTVGLTLYL